MAEHWNGKPRRIVTGHDADGRSIIVLDDNPLAATSSAGMSEGMRTVIEIWSSVAMTDDRSRQGAGPQSATADCQPNATEIRMVEMPPGGRREMHCTDTLDYGLVLDGELYLVLEGGETLLHPGDVVVQRGTNHFWHNRSDATTRIAFINITGHTTDRRRCPDV
jgi:quercetin dioxygenase-like cupin family protein